MRDPTFDIPSNVNRKRDDGSTPLYEAARRGHIETTVLLIDSGADVVERTQPGKTPLYVAADQSAEITMMFLGKGADPALVDRLCFSHFIDL